MGVWGDLCFSDCWELYRDLNMVQPKPIKENETQPDGRLGGIIEALTEGGRELESD